MLTFFRRLRKGLLGEGAMSKYLLYAIGEIALVVIGILIALQINNWNLQRQQKVLEKSTLREINFALYQDSIKIEQNIKQHFQVVEGANYLLQHISDKLPYTPELDSLFSQTYRPFFAYMYNTSAFDLLKERGLDIVSNESLRRNIGEYYTGAHSTIKGHIGKFLAVHTNESARIYPYFQTDHEPGKNMFLRPLDYESISSRDNIMNAFYHFRSINIALTIYLGEFLSETKKLMSEVKQALVKLEE